MKITRSVTTIASLTAVSRFFAVFREVLMSHLLGAGAMADAFVVAFRLPNLFRRSLAEGALNAAFVPLFASTMTKEGKEKAVLLAEHVMAVLFWVLLLLVLVVEALTPFVIYLIAPGFSSTPERFTMTVDFTRVTFPYILFISLAALFGGVLNSLNRFASPAATPILLNIVVIISLFSHSYLDLSPGYALSLSVSIAGVAQFLWLYSMCYRAGVPLRFRWPKLTSDVKEVIWLMIPGVIGASVIQINVFVDSQLASFLPEGAVAYLYYADRLNQLPLGVFGVAISTAMLPLLSKQIQSKDHNQALISQNDAIELALKLTIPSMVGLIILAYPMIALIYGHGKFGPEQISATAPALAAYVVGMPGYVMSKILTNSFFANKDTKTPVKIAVVIVIINALLAIIFMQFLQHIGMALATALAAWLNAIILMITLEKIGLFVLLPETIKNIGKIILASMSMGLVLYFLKDYTIPDPNGTNLNEMLGLFGVIAIGLFSFISVGSFLGVIHIFKKGFKSRK